MKKQQAQASKIDQNRQLREAKAIAVTPKAPVVAAPAPPVSSPRAAKSTLCPAHARAVQCRRSAARLGKILGRMRTWVDDDAALVGNARRDLELATLALTRAARGLETLPADWRPTFARGGGSRPTLDVGSQIEIRPKYRKVYDGILEPEDLAALEVIAVSRGGAVVCRNAGNPRLIFPRSHVMLAEVPAVASSPDDDVDEDDDA